jgi:hypothetical protein
MVSTAASPPAAGCSAVGASRPGELQAPESSALITNITAINVDKPLLALLVVCIIEDILTPLKAINPERECT